MCIRDSVQTVSTSNGVIFEGSAANDHEVTLLAGTVSADRTATLPDATGTVVLHDATQTLTNKTLTSPTITGTGTIAGTFTGGLTGDVTGNADTATLATTVTITANNSTDETVYPVFVDGATGTQGLESDTGLAYNPSSGNLTIGGTVDGRDLATDGSKLDGIESGATADQTNAEIRTAVEAASDSNVFTDADHTKLNGIEASATADQTDAEIRAAVEAATDSNVFTDADHTKLNGIEASATADQTAAEILTAIKTVDGASSGLDADLLDGQHGAHYRIDVYNVSGTILN